MGAKDSKRLCICYEDAVKRMSDAEYKRVCAAFKRLSGNNSLLSRTAFIQNVLGDGVPGTIADWLYNACGGGPRGIAQKDLICGLVLLTKGSQEEKIRFLWSLYCNDAGTFITKSEFQTALQTEGSPSKDVKNNSTPNIQWERTLLSLFGVGQDKVTFEHFRAWIQYNKDATILSKWLLANTCVSLSSEVETPTFYQTLAGVTHLEEQEICELEKCFWSFGHLDLNCFRALVCPPVPHSACEGLFLALDVNRDGHIDFKELCCGISAACRGPTAERMKFCFKMFDIDKDSSLNKEELKHMLQTLYYVSNDTNNLTRTNSDRYNSNYNTLTSNHTSVSELNNRNLNATERHTLLHEKTLDSLSEKIDINGMLSQEEFLVWAVQHNTLLAPLLELLFQVCHVALGLRPHCRHHEHEIVMGWVEREERRGYHVGQFWYLVSSEWWQHWLQYTSSPKASSDHCNCRIDPRHQIEEGIVCDESLISNGTDYTLNSNEFNSNSIESMGDLFSRGDSCSLASVSSSGVSSSSGTGSKRSSNIPGPIDNSSLVAEPIFKVPTLTGEGGRLKKDTPLVQHRDFELLPESLWKALALWYGGPLPLPRQVIRPPGDPHVLIELYPPHLQILRHQNAPAPTQHVFTTVIGGYGAAALSSAGLPPNTSVLPTRRYLAHTATFSRLANIKQLVDFLCSRLALRTEDVRVWHVKNENTNLLEDEGATLQDLGIVDCDQILLEVRNKDLTWPEELGALAAGTGDRTQLNSERRLTISLPPGATGLHNLGNTCFMNSALQAVSNTRPLTLYFQRDAQLCELNSANPLGTKGMVARRYAELCRELWAGSTRSVAPLKLRYCVTKHAPHLGGGGQHDSQELLAWLLDALHEDLNRVPRKQYTELKDSGGRPDEIVAEEAWQQHLARDHSIITDLFYGQLKSKVTCQTCGHESVRFDPFNLLSLPLPMESYTLCEVLVVKLNSDIPVKYGLRLNSEAKYLELKEELNKLCNISETRLLIAEVASSQIKQILNDDEKICPKTATELYAYELPESIPNFCGKVITNLDNLDNDRTNKIDDIPLAKSPEVSGGSALCMPNILCFKNKQKTDTSIPNGISYRKASMSLQNNKFEEDLSKLPKYLIAVHRKCVRQETYFLSQQKSKPSLFGLPLLLGCNSYSTCKSLYQSVWNQVTRLLSPLPQSDQTNHATDCDDSLKYEFPFTLKAVLQGGQICAICHWTQFCRGCTLPCTEGSLFDYCNDGHHGQSVMRIAIDWDPTALHLRYQSNREKVWLEDDSIALCRKLHTEPIDLDYCLRAFTSEEKLEAKYHCSNCKDKQPATKKLQIWKLPPILIIHLKRFDFVSNKWVKTQKAVNFPFKNFDPTAYLASVPQETILRHQQILENKQKDLLSSCESHNSSDRIDEENEDNNSSSNLSHNSSNGDTINEHSKLLQNGDITQESNDDQSFLSPQKEVNTSPLSNNIPKVINNNNNNPKKINEKTRTRLESTSLLKTPILDEHLKDYHDHFLTDGQDAFDLKYQLYAVVSHSGNLTSGHYISYACNPNGNWYCYNDSSCREVLADPPEKPKERRSAHSTPNSTPLSLRKSIQYSPKLTKKHIEFKENTNLSDTAINNHDFDTKSVKNASLESLATPPGLMGVANTSRSNLSTASLDLSSSKTSLVKCVYSNSKTPKIDTSSAYILFYERSGLNYKPYLPDVTTVTQVIPEVELDENESELRKQLCNIQ